MKCSFCGNEMEEGTGKLVVKSDGTVLSFCKSKCERNHRIRSPRNVKWTEIYRTKDKKKAVQNK